MFVLKTPELSPHSCPHYSSPEPQPVSMTHSHVASPQTLSSLHSLVGLFWATCLPYPQEPQSPAKMQRLTFADPSSSSDAPCLTPDVLCSPAPLPVLPGLAKDPSPEVFSALINKNYDHSQVLRGAFFLFLSSTSQATVRVVEWGGGVESHCEGDCQFPQEGKTTSSCAFMLCTQRKTKCIGLVYN